jgi:hypothetical protein
VKRVSNWRRILLAAASMLILGSASSVWAFSNGTTAVRQPAIVKVAAGRKAPAKPKTDQAVEQPAPALANEEPGDRARRLLDLETERLERNARKAMQSICRGC